MSTLQHIAISAAAGSGKTYQLTNRFIQLLHLTEQPERIIALTFTRTASGEFFQKIVEKLSEAAKDTDRAKALSKELSIDADSGRYHQLLKLLIGKMHQLNLQTLDSFFFRIVSSFALEFGLSGNLNLLDESSEPRVRNQVRDQIVYRQGALTEELNEFWHAFKQATYGKEERSVERIVTDYIERLYNLYLDTPQAARWGQSEQIWLNGCPWLSNQSTDWTELANAIETHADPELSKQKAFQTLLSDIEHYPSQEKMNTLLKRVLEISSDLFGGSALLKVGRKEFTLSPELCRAMADALRAVFWHHLQRALQNTQGVFRILEAYDANYERLVRRAGRLSFADLTHLLAPNHPGSSMGPIDRFTRELMDYRIDGQFDHWLFDEFQDTSRAQWGVVSNLIDEVLQDGSGQRSLFYVGDTKQCLYLWRNGDDRLFHDIKANYTNIESKPLSMSWRSAPAILEAVNTVFSDPALIAECFSQDAAARWARAWQTHQASPATKDLSGYACWLRVQKEESPNRNEKILTLLEELKPSERGLSVGILVRKNADANEIADYLREHSSLQVHTGSAIQPARDNAAGVCLLTLLRLAAHPGDGCARGYLEMVEQSSAGPSLIDAARKLRHRLHTENFGAALTWAVEQITPRLPKDDSRHRRRLDQLIEQAYTYESDELRSIDGLHAHLERTYSNESAHEESIIVETIHKSKGLEYDIVILINEDKTVRSERQISAYLNPEGEAEWIVEPLKKELMQCDPELNKLYTQSESQRGFGSLCTLYVGMTRAKRALYMISDFERVSKGSTVDFLREQLGNEPDAEGVLWRCGDPNWIHSCEFVESEPLSEQEPSNDQPTFVPAHQRLQLLKPSTAASTQINTGRFFQLNDQSSQFGTAVHAAFEQIEWLGPELPNYEPEVATTLEKCFQDDAIRQLFTQPESPCLAWRERAFSYVEGHHFINGVFDRVHLFKNEDGEIIQATIIDFKTDRIHEKNTIDQAVEHHRPQLEAYRKALSKVTHLDQSAISLVILFTDAPALRTL